MTIKRLMNIFTILALLLGACGAALRRLQFLTIVDEVTGLAQPWARVSVVLLVTCGLIVLSSFIMSLTVKRVSETEGHGLREVFGAPKKLPRATLPVLGFLAFALVAVTAIRYYIAVRTGQVTGLERFAPDAVMTALAVLAGLAVLTLAVRIVTFAGVRGSAAEIKLAMAALTVFPCYHMVLTYLNYVASPNLLLYSYDMIALGVTALAALYAAGFTFTPETASPKWTLMFLWIAITFNGVAAGNPAQPRFRGIFIFHALTAFVAALLMIPNLFSENSSSNNSYQISNIRDEGLDESSEPVEIEEPTT
ncbi:MAG: hypothetical protein LBM98_01620 [Oscillospiraceae bacterium]|nr:hypothetical protein [Oscillospiraceae bacterium]